QPQPGGALALRRVAGAGTDLRTGRGDVSHRGGTDTILRPVRPRHRCDPRMSVVGDGAHATVVCPGLEAATVPSALKVVALGGGTGVPLLLRGLKDRSEERRVGKGGGVGGWGD